uniref:MFS domain-containing protein n=1 Tax=Panagrellus redivivus TaxID=6233 RepID=A0A7E4VEQ9_PANRE
MRPYFTVTMPSSPKDAYNSVPTTAFPESPDLIIDQVDPLLNTQRRPRASIDCLRWILAVLLLIVLSALWGNIIAFNFSLVCAVPSNSPNYLSFLPQETSVRLRFLAYEQAALTIVVAVTALIGTIGVLYALPRYGIRLVLIPLALLSALVTSCLPSAMIRGFWPTLIMRGLQGFGLAAIVPVIGVFSTKWSTPTTIGTVISGLFAYFQLAPILVLPLSGAICGSGLGWEGILYVQAGICVFCAAAFGIVFRESPDFHPLLQLDPVSTTETPSPPTPYKSIFKTPSVWAIWLAGAGYFLVLNSIFLFAPHYLHHVHGFSATKAGLLATIPPLIELIVKVAAEFGGEKIHRIGVTCRLRLFNSIAFFGSALLLLVLSFMSIHHSFICYSILVASTGVLGLAAGGFLRAVAIVSRQFSHFVTGVMAIGAITTLLLSPILVHGIAPTDNPIAWRIVFWILGAILVLTNTIFISFVNGRPATWTRSHRFSTRPPSTRTLIRTYSLTHCNSKSSSESTVIN